MPLIQAARAGHPETCEVLLGLHADPNEQDSTMTTALEAALLAAKNASFTALLARGADPLRPGRGFARLIDRVMACRPATTGGVRTPQYEQLRAMLDALLVDERLAADDHHAFRAREARRCVESIERETVAPPRPTLDDPWADALLAEAWRVRTRGGSSAALVTDVLASREAVARAAWPELVLAILALAPTYEQEAQEVYGVPVRLEDDEEGPLQDSWAEDEAYALPELVLERMLATAAAAEHARWGELVLRALETCTRCHRRPSRALVDAVCEAGATAGRDLTEIQARARLLDGLGRALEL